MAPMGIGTIQPRWRGVRGGCHPAQSCARYARAPKSVIHLKVFQESPEFRFRENPARVGPGASRNISETARAGRNQMEAP